MGGIFLLSLWKQRGCVLWGRLLRLYMKWGDSIVAIFNKMNILFHAFVSVFDKLLILNQEEIVALACLRDI